MFTKSIRPSAWARKAMALTSSVERMRASVLPPMRTPRAKSGEVAARMARSVSSKARMRFSKLPP